MAAEQVEHVVEEADPGGGARPRRRRGRAELDLRLVGAALDRRGARHRCSILGASRRRCAPRPMRRARGSPRRRRSSPPSAASSTAAAGSISTTLILRRKVAGPERAGEAAGAAGRQHVVGARRRSRRRPWRRAGRRTRSRRVRTVRARARVAPAQQSSRCSGASASASATAVGHAPAVDDDRQRRIADARLPAAIALDLGRDPLGHRRIGADRGQQAVAAVLGLGAEVEREPLAPAPSRRPTTTSSEGPA